MHLRPRFEADEWTLTQSMDKINMVYPRKILLAENWGSFRFLLVIFFHFFILTLDLELTKKTPREGL